MVFKSTYFLKILFTGVCLSACTEDFVDKQYVSSVAGYQRGANQTADIQRRSLNPQPSVSSSASNSNIPVIVNDPFSYGTGLAPNPVASIPTYNYGGGSAYGSLANGGNGVIAPNVFIQNGQQGYVPAPNYGNNGVYSPIRR
jgi:hypothetical protein